MKLSKPTHNALQASQTRVDTTLQVLIIDGRSALLTAEQHEKSMFALSSLTCWFQLMVTACLSLHNKQRDLSTGKKVSQQF